MTGRNNHNANVVPIRPDLRSIGTHRDPATDAFDALTVELVMARHARGELEPALLEALLVGVGFNVEAP